MGSRSRFRTASVDFLYFCKNQGQVKAFIDKQKTSLDIFKIYMDRVFVLTFKYRSNNNIK